MSSARAASGLGEEHEGQQAEHDDAGNAVTLLTAEMALQHGIACHLAGGTHHAHYDHPAGFCIFNDLAIISHYLLQSGRVDRVLHGARLALEAAAVAVDADRATGDHAADARRQQRTGVAGRPVGVDGGSAW